MVSHSTYPLTVAVCWIIPRWPNSVDLINPDKTDMDSSYQTRLFLDSYPTILFESRTSTMSYRLSPQSVQADTTPVTSVRVVVHTRGAAGPNTSDNHWSIFLLHRDGTSSTRVNMRADFGNTTGFLEWTRLRYTRATSAITYWDFPVASGTTVLFFARLIYGLRRDRYRMSGGGSGCRWWVYTVVLDFARRNFIRQNAPNEIWTNLLYLYHTHRPRTPMRMVQGQFY